MCLNEAFCKVHIGKHMSDRFLVQNDLKQEDALSSLLFNFAIEHTIIKARENKDGLETNQLLFYADDVNLLGERTNTFKKSTESLLEASKEAGWHKKLNKCRI
jgi:hypothetical protein